MRKIISLIALSLICIVSFGQVNGNFKQVRLLNNADSTGIANVGIIRYDPTTGKYRFWNSLTSQWMSFMDASNSNKFWKTNASFPLTSDITVSGNQSLQFSGMTDFNITTSSFGGSGNLSTNVVGNTTFQCDNDIIFNAASHVITSNGHFSVGTSVDRLDLLGGMKLRIDNGLTFTDYNATSITATDVYTIASGSKSIAFDPTNGLKFTLGSDATGDIWYRNSSGYVTRLAAVATGNALISGGVTTAPSWGKIGLTTHVSGTLPVANGGTGTTTPGLVAGTNVSITGTWPNQTVNSTGSPGGSDTQIQFNSSGSFAGDADLTFTGGNTLNATTIATGTNKNLFIQTSGSTEAIIQTPTSSNTAGFSILSAAGDGTNGQGRKILLSTGQAFSGSGAVGGDIQMVTSVGDGAGAAGNITMTPSGNGDIKLTVSSGSGSYIIMTGLPTSCSGAPTGALANVSGTLTVCP